MSNIQTNQPIEEYVVQPAIVSRNVKLEVEVILGARAIVRALFYEDNAYMGDNPIAQKILLIEGDDYKNWGNDDSYLERIVFEKLGIIKKIM